MKKGFTLAEILITLGIIGVVAALTAPALVQNAGNAKIGPSLAKFVNTFEVGTEKMMLDEGLGSFATTTTLPIEILAKYVVMAPYSGEHTFKNGDESKEYNFKEHTIKGSSVGDVVLSQDQNFTDQVWQMKDGTIVSFLDIGETRALAGKGSYTMIVGAALVDINGASGPNKAGRDVFAFLIDKSGILIPVGGNTHRFIKENFDLGDYKLKYNENCNISAANIGMNFACTGQIADNGWKVVD